MASLESLFEKIVEDEGGLLNLAAKAVDKNGNIIFQKSTGYQKINRQQKLLPDAVYFIASCSKLVTTIAAMQCVERGIVGLDEDVTKYLPELKDAPVMSLSEAFNHMLPGGNERLKSGDIPKIITKARQNTITLRQFLTNTSGLAYDEFETTSLVWRAHRGEGALTNHCVMINLYEQPPIFEPGTSWVYGLGFEWAGELVARLNNTTLENYLQENIFKPLGCQSTTFRPWTNEVIAAREIDLAVRSPDGKLAHAPRIIHQPAKSDMGGIGLYSTVEDYSRIIGDLIAEVPKLLRVETAELFFQSQLGAGSGPWQALVDNHFIWAPLTGISATAGPEIMQKIDFGLSGVLVAEDTPMLPRGTLSWWGMPNIVWFANRRLGVAGLVATQLLPPGDATFVELSNKFREHVLKVASS